MSQIIVFLEINRDITLFIYGLVFFSLGLSLALQTHSHSRLELARYLKWMAGFGLIHGVYEWGELFIPLQAPLFDPSFLWFSTGIQLLLLSLSFTCLFKFGWSFLRFSEKARWLGNVPWIIWGGWLLTIFVILMSANPTQEAWRNISNALARYLISFPAGLVASFGLFEYTRKNIKPLNLPVITQMLYVVSAALLLYAFLSGLIPPPVSFFPGSILNTQVFSLALGVPVRVFRSMIGLVLTIATIRALEIFDVEYTRYLEQTEKKVILSAERERLARDLHDGAIQSVYSAGLAVDSALRLAPPSSEIAQRLGKAASILDATLLDLRQSLISMANQDQPQDLWVELKQLIQDPYWEHSMKFSLNLDSATLPVVSSGKTYHVLSLFREALANVIRHSKARTVDLKVSCLNNVISIELYDDGVGIPINTPPGFGIRNMHDRARLLDGTLVIESQSDKGTRLVLSFPLEEEA